MDLKETTEKVQSLAASKGGKIGAKIKFQFEEGVIYLNDNTAPTQVSNDDQPADCTVRVSLSDFNKLMTGDLKPMGAFMMGKLKVDGDMSIAMKLSSLF